MDCVQTAMTGKAGLRRETVMFSYSAAAAAASAAHCQPQLLYLQSPLSSSLPAEDAACTPVDRSGFLWEDFSVDDLLDLGGGKELNGDDEDFFPAEEAEEEEEEEEERKDSPTDFNTCSSSVLSFQALPSSSDPMVPAGDVADLEWVSRFVDDSYSEFPSALPPPPETPHAPPPPAAQEAAEKAEASKPQGTSPGVALKRSWGSCCFSADSVVVPAKARSKRPRPGGRVWSLGLPSLLAESSSSSCSSGSSTSSCSASSSISLYEQLGSSGGVSPRRLLDCLTGRPLVSRQQQPPQLQVKKKKGRKPKALAAATAVADGSYGGEQQTRRRCSHCGVDKTPQWRAGPMGAKTLCNACGVRYKSGRLLPEYRPAGSPTFLSDLHSNSHRKVLEMRRKKELLATGTSVPVSCSPVPPPQLAVASQPYGVV